MIIRRSYLNGRLENKVDDFIATLENEFDYVVLAVTVQTVQIAEDGSSEKVMHVFHCAEGDTSFVES